MNCRDEVTNRDLQDSYLAMSSKEIENHQKLFLFYGIRPTIKWSRRRTISWYLGVIMVTGHHWRAAVVTSAHVMLSLTKSLGDWHRARPLWLRSPLGSESPRPGRKRGPSQSVSRGSGWLIINILARQITSAIDGQLLIQHHNHINQARHQTK